VIASRASGFTEIVRDRENGLLVDVDDVQSLRAAIEMLQRGDLTAESTAALRTAADFSWQSIAARYRELIEHVSRHSAGT